METLKCPVCGKELKNKYGLLTCDCGWSDPTAHKPLGKATRRANSAMSY